MANQPPPPQFNNGLIAGLIKGNQWVFISPDHKAGYSWGGTSGGVGLPVMRPIVYKKIQSTTNPEVTHVFCVFCCVRMLDICALFVFCVNSPHCHCSNMRCSSVSNALLRRFGEHPLSGSIPLLTSL